jgi:hypothetical protein
MLLTASFAKHAASRQSWTSVLTVIQGLTRRVSPRVSPPARLRADTAQNWHHTGAAIHMAASQSATKKYSDEALAARNLAHKLRLLNRRLTNLLHAYAVSVKHAFCGESGAYYDDLYQLIRDLPRYAGTRVQKYLLPMRAQSLDIAVHLGDIESGLAGAPVERSATRDSICTAVDASAPEFRLAFVSEMWGRLYDRPE